MGGDMGATIVEKHLKTMIERGHKYLYLERELGRGICLTLGVDSRRPLGRGCLPRERTGWIRSWRH